MKKLIIILASALLLAACGNQSVKTACAAPGIAPVNVKFGLYDVKVRPGSINVRKNTALRIKPKESRKSRRWRESQEPPVAARTVTVSSVQADCTWISGSGTSEFDVCQKGEGKIDLVCKYAVDVSAVGTLDPYAKIIPE